MFHTFLRAVVSEIQMSHHIVTTAAAVQRFIFKKFALDLQIEKKILSNKILSSRYQWKMKMKKSEPFFLITNIKNIFACVKQVWRLLFQFTTLWHWLLFFEKFEFCLLNELVRLLDLLAKYYKKDFSTIYSVQRVCCFQVDWTFNF